MRLTYRPDIDGLRAVAVLSVLGFHAFPTVFPGGFIGVDVFFVISGFLITSILHGELVEGRWSLAGFYARRILRIFPALLLILLVGLSVGWHALLADEYKQFGKHTAAGAAFISNFAFWFEVGYFDQASDAKPLLHLWSLGIEEQFYIVWPLLLWGAWRGGRHVSAMAMVVLMASLLFASALVFADRTQAFYSPLSRAWELLAGAMLALQVQRGRGLPAVLRTGASRWLALGLLVASIFLLRAEYPFPGALALVPVVAAVVLVAVPVGTTGATSVLASRPMVAIGLISYPLYLWHWPLLSFARIIESGEPSALVRVGLVLASIVLAALTYWLLEKPMRRLPRRWAVGGLAIGMVIVGALGKNIYDRDGLERIRHKRMIHVDERAAQDFVDFEKTGLITDAKCEQPFKFPERDVCLVAEEGKPVTAVVLGDSHAVHAFWGLARTMARTTGDNVKVLGKGACVPFLNYPPGKNTNQCQPHINQTLGAIANTPAIRKVVLVYRGRYLRPDASPEEIAVFQAGLDATLNLLTQARKEVYYFLPVVEPGFDPKLCLGSLPFGRKPPFPCEIDKAGEESRTALLRSLVSKVVAAYPQVTVVDPNDKLCDGAVCPIIRGGHSVFKDSNHLSQFGSLLAGEAMAADREN